jgi:hypothetical protein
LMLRAGEMGRKHGEGTGGEVDEGSSGIEEAVGAKVR